MSVTLPEGCCRLFTDCTYEDRESLTTPKTCGDRAVAWWSYLFMMIVLVPACHGLVKVASGIVNYQLTTVEYVYLALSVLGLLVLEGYLGFHCSWSPATARRALVFAKGLDGVSGCRKALLIVMAPFYAAGFFYAPCRRLVIAYVLPPFIVGLVFLVVQMPSPAHEIVDCGVASGLCTGTLSFSWYFLRSVWTGVLPVDVDYNRSTKGLEQPLIQETGGESTV